jgi:hypothetical protein
MRRHTVKKTLENKFIKESICKIYVECLLFPIVMRMERSKKKQTKYRILKVITLGQLLRNKVGHPTKYRTMALLLSTQTYSFKEPKEKSVLNQFYILLKLEI